MNRLPKVGDVLQRWRGSMLVLTPPVEDEILYANYTMDVLYLDSGLRGPCGFLKRHEMGAAEFVLLAEL